MELLSAVQEFPELFIQYFTFTTSEDVLSAIFVDEKDDVIMDFIAKTSPMKVRQV